MGRKDKEIPIEENGILSLGGKLRYARSQKGISLTQMAKDLGYTKSHLSAVENGTGRPSRELVESYEKKLGLKPGELAHVDQDQSALGRKHTPFYTVKEDEGQEKGSRTMQNGRREQGESYVSLPVGRGRIEDWGEAPNVRNFYGRERELTQLRQWIVDERCQLVTILGIGGVGKTALTSTAARQLMQAEGEFKAVFWRSLRDIPVVEEILRDCIRHFSGQRHVDFPESVDGQIALLIEYLQQNRCLLVLDNFEPVLQAGSLSGQYREGYEGYGKLIERVGTVQHNSCLLLTSREKPKEVASLEIGEMPTRTLQLSGVGEVEGHNILKDNKLVGSDEALIELTQIYSGNPLALRLIAAPIRDMFGGDVDAFLDTFRLPKEGEEEAIIVGDIAKLLDQQFQRLSEQEQDIMYWLALEREAVSLNDLQNDNMRVVSRGGLFQILETLRHRSMIESKGNGRFTLQPAIMEYTTERLVNRLYEEITAEKIGLLATHLLIKAQAKDYVRNTQTRFILSPLANRLLSTHGQEVSEKKLRNILSQLRESYQHTPGYAAGNILNLLIHLGCALDGYDFSHLFVWQAYLQGIELPRINFAHAELGRSVFTDTFERVLTAKLSPNGTLLAAGTGNGDVRIWDASSDTPTPVHICRGHTDWVRSIAFSHDGKMLVSGSDDQTIRLWDVDTGECLQTLEGSESRVFAVAWHHDGNIIASGNQDGTVRIWDVRTGQCLRKLEGQADRVWSVAFKPESDVLASGGGKAVWLWNVRTGQCLVKLEGHSDRVRSVTFSSDGMLLASGSRDRTVRVWDVRNGQCLWELDDHSYGVRSVDFSPNSKMLASGAEDRTVILWDMNTGQLLRTLEGHDNWVRSVSFSTDGKTIVTTSEDQTVRLWDVSTRQCLKTLQGHSDWVYAVAFSPDGELLATGSGDLMVRLWRVSTGQALRALQGHTNWIRSVAFSPDGQLLASGGEDLTVRLWKVSTGQSLNALQGHTAWVYAVAFSPDGKIIASGSEDRTVWLWDVSTGLPFKKLLGHRDWVRSVAFSPDGELLASGGEDRTVRLWKVSTGQLLETLQGYAGRVYSVIFSPDGKTIASGSEDGEIKLWDVDTKHCRETLKGHNGRVWSTSFSPDGKVIASGSEDRTVQLWDASTGQRRNMLGGFTSRVYSTAFSPDGSTVAGGSPDGTVKLWEVQTGDLVQTLRRAEPYEGMNIAGVEGLTPVQKDMLKSLGAIEK